MKVRIGLLIVLLGIGCRPSADPVAEPDSSSEQGSIAAAWLAQPRSKTGSGYKPPPREPKSKLEPKPEPTAALEVSACEYVCADVHACVLEEGREPSAAASIELGCLDACVRVPTAFATCQRPASIGAEPCGDYLECVRETWPSGERSPTEIVDQPAGNGCDLACAAFARCYDASIDAAEECGRQCRAALTEDLQRVAGECARLDGCAAIESCVQALPGA